MSQPGMSTAPIGNTIPAIPGFYSDPTWCRGRDAYYLANSSFEYFPGAPIFRSEDLETWTQIGNVIDRPEQTPLLGAGASAGIFGSTLRFHDDTYWFITTNIDTVRDGQQIFTAKDPEGPWSDAVVVPGTAGIDPDLYWDADGTCYLSWTRMGIQQAKVDPVAGVLLSEPQPLWNGVGMKAPEGPHIYHVGEWYYLLIAEGGTERGHCVSIARGRSAEGPFEGHPANPILTHRSTSHPIQSVGHADLLEGPDGTWWLTYHGTRPRGMTPEFHVIGRETMIAPVEWMDGWPVIREDLARRTPATTSYDDSFTGPLHPRWVSPGGDLSGVSTGSGLRLSASETARPVMARVQDLSWRATITLDVSEGAARVLVYLDDAHWYGIDVSSTEATAVARIGPLCQELGSAAVADPSAVVVSIDAAPPALEPYERALEPDFLTFSVGDTVLARLEGRYLSTEVATRFTGRTVGVDPRQGTVRVTRFSYEGRDALD